MIYTLQEMRQMVLNDFNQSGAQGFLTSANIDYWINDAYMQYVGTLMRADEGYFEETQLLSITAESESVELPSFYTNKKPFIRATLLEKVLPDRTIPLDYNRRHNTQNITSGYSAGEQYLPSYRFRGKYIILEPTPASSETDALLLTMQVMPPRLRAGNPQDATLSTITLDTGADVRDDYYNGARIMIVSGDGEGQIRVISDYVGSTRVATLSSDFDTLPSATSEFCILIHDDFPEMFHQLLPLSAVRRAFQKERSRGAKISWDESILLNIERDFKNTFENRSTARKFTQPFNIEM